MDCSIQAQKLLLIAVKTPESMKNFAQKILERNSFKWGIYRPIWKIAVGCNFCQKYPVGRPAGRPPNGQILNRCSYRSTARSTQTNREQTCYSRSTARSTGYKCNQRARFCARRSTHTVDRLLGAVDRPVDRPSLADSKQVRKTG